MQEWVGTVVIDDQESELNPFANSLGAKGIPCIPILVKGAAEFTEACKECQNKNIRVIITDIQMFSKGAAPDNNDFAAISSAINLIYNDQQVPYILFVWTSKPEHFDDLVAYLNRGLVCKPRHIVPISKTDHRNASGEFDLNKIYGSVSSFLNNDIEFKALLGWEKSVALAAHETINEVFMLNPSAVKETLARLINQVAGVHSPSHEAVAINEALQYLLKDKLSYICLDDKNNKIWKDAVSDVALGEVSPVLAASLNKVLYLETNRATKLICPGDFFQISDKKGFLENYKLGEAANIFDSFFQMKNQKPLKNFKSRDRATAKTAVEAIRAYQKEAQTIIDQSILGLIEISPDCDFAQGKKPVNTYLLSMLVPYTTINAFTKTSIASGPSINTLKIHVPDPKGDYCLIASSKIIISANNSEMDDSKGMIWKFRLREGLLKSWIHSASSYNSRIGNISFF